MPDGYHSSPPPFAIYDSRWFYHATCTFWKSEWLQRNSFSRRNKMLKIFGKRKTIKVVQLGKEKRIYIKAAPVWSYLASRFIQPGVVTVPKEQSSDKWQASRVAAWNGSWWRCMTFSSAGPHSWGTNGQRRPFGDEISRVPSVGGNSNDTWVGWCWLLAQCLGILHTLNLMFMKTIFEYANLGPNNVRSSSNFLLVVQALPNFSIIGLFLNTVLF